MKTKPGNRWSFHDLIADLLVHIGEDPQRPGLLDTPARVTNAWKEWSSGYTTDISAIFKTFKDGAENVDEMIVIRDIPFYTHCEHHLAPFFGKATIAYIPDGHILGLSKFNRLVDAYARRLQVQERLTTQIAEAIMKYLAPVGCGVVVTARHLCMESRGIKQQGHSTVTSALRGAFKEEPELRAEFMLLAHTPR